MREEGKDYRVCIKDEYIEDSGGSMCIRFQESSYAEIDERISHPGQPNINRFLDSTFGYYTLDTRHGYVLAHYNWHKFACGIKGDRPESSKSWLKGAEQIMNRRLSRLDTMCRTARSILCVHDKLPSLKTLKIGPVDYQLSSHNEVEKVFEKRYSKHARLIAITDFLKPDLTELLVNQLVG